MSKLKKLLFKKTFVNKSFMKFNELTKKDTFYGGFLKFDE